MEQNIKTLDDFLDIVKRRKKFIIWPALADIRHGGPRGLPDSAYLSLHLHHPHRGAGDPPGIRHEHGDELCGTAPSIHQPANHELHAAAGDYQPIQPLRGSAQELDHRTDYRKNAQRHQV